MNYMLTLLLLFLVSNASVYRVSYASSSYSRLVINSGLEHPHHHAPSGEQPLAKIAIHKTVLALHKSAYIRANPFLLGLK
nr:nucleotide pyrophosphatase/phosphodiesterase-like [Tanacetum cinerariifolium]